MDAPKTHKVYSPAVVGACACVGVGVGVGIVLSQVLTPQYGRALATLLGAVVAAVVGTIVLVVMVKIRAARNKK